MNMADFITSKYLKFDRITTSTFSAKTDYKTQNLTNVTISLFPPYISSLFFKR